MQRGLVLLLIVVQAYFTVATIRIRGYFAIGGEWLIVPAYLLILVLVDQIKEAWEVYKRNE